MASKIQYDAVATRVITEHFLVSASTRNGLTWVLCILGISYKNGRALGVIRHLCITYLNDAAERQNAPFNQNLLGGRWS
jgi:hypothetical protein